MGGAEVALLDMLASIRQAAPDWKLDLILAGDGPLAAKAGALGVNTIVLPFPRSLARIGDASAGGPAGKQTSRLLLLSRLLIACPGIATYILRLRKAIRR
ncbi:MAG TPA: hypothetical protein VN920_13240, partial [Pyrinomonadaceae bacterium]|nr:hypothetical protein [Pyrinomonadaceae bacterium]